MGKIDSKLPAAVALWAVLLPLAAARPAASEVVNRIVLRINDRIATLHEYEMRRSALLAEVLQQELLPAELQRRLEAVGQQVFRDLFEEVLLLSRADQLEIEITDKYLDAYMDYMRENMGYPDQQAFVAAVRQSGMTFEEFRLKSRDNLRMREVITREVEQPIEDDLKEEDLRLYYRNHPEEFRQPEQVHLREVVVLEDSDLTAAERRELAELIREQVSAGKTLEEVVEPYSENGMTGKAIELGWIEPGELDPALEAAVFDLPAGTVSEPVEGRGGLHVVEVTERKESTLLPFDEVAPRIRAREGRRLSNERLPAYMEELETSSYLRVAPPPEAEGFRTAQARLADELPDVPEEAVPEDTVPEAVDPEEPPAEGEAPSAEDGSPEAAPTEPSPDPAPV